MNWLQPEEDFKGLLSDDFFNDLIINHFDCPLDNGEGDWVVEFQDLEPPSMDMFTSELTSCINGKASHVGIQNITPALKQSTSSEDLTGINSTLHQSSSPPPDIKVSKLFQSSSPVSVLVNSCDPLSSHNSTSQKLAFPVKGKRSKRKRPTALRFSYLIPFEPRQSKKLTPEESESESYYSSNQQTKKKRKIHPTRQTVSSTSSEVSNLDEIVRKCTHCETTKTPQWREGPNGPKTLCNACGVRFRSGRLVPEYRPASSPTFIPSVHSNLHRKIIEMRNKGENQFMGLV